MNIEKHKGNINKAKGVNNPLPIILSSRADLANMSRGQTSSRRAPAWRQACSWKLGDIFGEQTRTTTHIFIINSSRLQLPCKMGQCFLAKAKAEMVISCKERAAKPWTNKQRQKHGWSNPGLIWQVHTENLSVKTTTTKPCKVSSCSWGKRHRFEEERPVLIPKASLPSGSFPSRNAL